jgi:hypothetical protein
VQIGQIGVEREHTLLHACGCLLVSDPGVWMKQLYQVLFQWDAVAFGTRFSLPK